MRRRQRRRHLQNEGRRQDQHKKQHSVPGKRRLEHVRDAYALEATLASNRVPAMWDHPFYTDLYEQIVALDESSSIVDNRALSKEDPDVLRAELESRSRACKEEQQYLTKEMEHEGTFAPMTLQHLATVQGCLDNSKKNLWSKADSLLIASGTLFPPDIQSFSTLLHRHRHRHYRHYD